MVRNLILIFTALFLLSLSACRKDADLTGDLQHLPYNPVAYILPDLPDHFPPLTLPADNPLTTEGVRLGRMLFYDPILSVDSTLACADCHQQKYAFAAPTAFSEGVDGQVGIRNAMSLGNVAFFQNGLFWDGRSASLEAQALHPIEDPLEMAHSIEVLLSQLREHLDYPERFRAAFGITDRSQISAALLGKALAQFERTLISFNAKYDYANWDRGAETQFYSPAELRGKTLFATEPVDPNQAHPGCTHCHNVTALVTTDEYHNNGLDEVFNLQDFPDLGLGAVTGKLIDNGKFRVPSLRNIALTAPYMHDGRLATLSEVLDHYASGGHYADNLDANIQPFPLDEQDRADLLAFLNTLTDTLFTTNPEFGNPFVE